MGAYHDFEGGRTLEESIEIAKYLEDLGIDALDVDLGCYERKQWIVPSIYAGDSCMAEAASRIKGSGTYPGFECRQPYAGNSRTVNKRR